MKKFGIILMILIPILLNANEITSFTEFLRDVKSQTIQYSNSPLHQQIKNSRDIREYEVGDEVTFWSWTLTVMPPTWILTPATCRGVGEHCYVFVADDQWDIHMDQSDVDLVMLYLEEETMATTEYGVIEMDTLRFGPIPDELDNDPKIIVFYSELGSYMGTSFDGYFSSYNQVTEAEAQTMNPPGHSNECEMIYMTCHPLNPTDPIRISVLAHELQHMIHWLGDVNESTWVDEGCAELAMVYFGLPDPVVSFPNNPDNSLINWEQQFADYVKVMLFFTYLSEQYDEDDLIKNIVSEPLNSISGISNQLEENEVEITFEELFTDWTIANYLDDPDIEDGLYNYEQLDLPGFSLSGFHSSYPAEGSGGINAWATDYIRLNVGNLDENSTLTASFDVNNPINLSVIYYESSGVVSSVVKHNISGLSELELIQSGESYYRLILVFSNINYSSVSYSYEIDAEVSAEEQEIFDSNYTVTCFPNPFFQRADNICFSIKDINIIDPNLILKIYNVQGQLVKSLFLGNNNKALWDGKNYDGKPVTNGLYFYTYNNNGKKISNKFVVLK